MENTTYKSYIDEHFSESCTAISYKQSMLLFTNENKYREILSHFKNNVNYNELLLAMPTQKMMSMSYTKKVNVTALRKN